VIVLSDDHNTFQGVAYTLSNVLPVDGALVSSVESLVETGAPVRPMTRSLVRESRFKAPSDTCDPAAEAARRSRRPLPWLVPHAGPSEATWWNGGAMLALPAADAEAALA
jgi:hypothetical protein